MTPQQNKKGFIRKVAGTVKNQVFFVFGTEHISAGYTILEGQWRSFKRRRCPNCERGSLFAFSERVDGKDQKFFGCNNCDYFQFHHLNRDPHAQSKLRSLALDKLASFTDEELQNQIRKYQITSRWMYGFAVFATLFGLGFLILMLPGKETIVDVFLTFLSILASGVLFFIKGLVASYRHYQLTEKVFFVSGSFQRWLYSGRWVI